MMLAFLVDQIAQLGCKTFAKALERLKTKKNLWEHKRGMFLHLTILSLEDMWNALAYGHQPPLAPNTS